MIDISDFEDLQQEVYRRNLPDKDEWVRAIAHLVLLSQMDSQIVKQAQQIVGGN